MAVTVQQPSDARSKGRPVIGHRPEHPANVAAECFVEALCAVDCDHDALEHGAYGSIALAREMDAMARGIRIDIESVASYHPVRAALLDLVRELRRVSDPKQALIIFSHVSAGIARELHRRAVRVRTTSRPEIMRGYRASEALIQARIPLNAFTGGQE